MALLRNADHGAWCSLHADHLIGRSSRCDLQIDEGYVSAQHATVRWTGSGWEIKDLGSRNGTLIDGGQLEPGSGRMLRKEAAISFGHLDQTWILQDDSEPRVMALPLTDGDPAFLDGDILPIPSSEAPEAVIVRAADGSWQLERPDGVLVRVDHDETFELAGNVWRFCCPNSVALTSALEGRPNLRDLSLRFAVSADEEHVELCLELPNRQVKLGSRTHNYILLTLARHRLNDAAAGVVASACGWVYQEDLLRELCSTATQLNVDIFRMRKQFATFEISDAAAIVERRPRSKQLRIGPASLSVNRI